MPEKTHKKKLDERLNFLSRYEEVFTNNPTWGRLEYLIQMAYTNVSIQIKKIYVIANKTMESKFFNINQDKTEFEVIISENQLNKAEDFNSVSEKGFKYPLNFVFGKMEIKNLQREPDDFYEVMICRAAIGKSYIYPSKNITDNIPYEQKPELMTSDFDSVCIYDELSVAKQFKQNYIIYDPQNKCLPEFIVHFTIDKARYRELEQKIICECCEDNIAQKYCETEDTYFCISCDSRHHKDKISTKHKRSELTEKPKLLGFCPNHSTLRMELYCMECNRTLCINCKVKGDHFSGEMLMHTLVRISEKYNETERSLREIDGELEKKKKHLQRSMSVVETKLKEINKKNEQVQNRIYEIMQQSLKQLEIITKKKMSLLMSDHIELKRQLDQILWMEKYLSYEHDVLSPNDFLLSFSRYETVKKDILANKFEVSNIMPDMRVEGYVNVVTEEQSRMQNMGKKRQLPEMEQAGGNQIFDKLDEKNTNVIKSRLPLNRPIDDSGKEEIIKSKNNLLNLSILKHI